VDGTGSRIVFSGGSLVFFFRQFRHWIVLNQSNLTVNPHLNTDEDVSVTLRKAYVGFEAPRFLIDDTR